MSKAIEHLLREHVLIQRSLGAFQAFAATLHSGSSSAQHRQELWPLLDYLCEVVMLRHEEKEETLLLPELSHRGEPWNEGPLAGTRRDHRHGRYLVRSLHQALHQAQAWTRDDERHFGALVTEWINFNRGHMEREERILFPLAAKDLDAFTHDRLAACFEKVDAEVAALPGSRELTERAEAFLRQFA